jgi:pyruvate/2-oxoglutarate dehydrogenase complex dihydrolipoamide acyltransferase (E2) component
MRASMAYFAGAGTVIAAIVAGIGGGLLMANIISPKTPKQELTRLERNVSPSPSPAATTPSGPVPYLAAPPPSAPGTTVAAAPAPPQTQTETANASAPAQAADTSQARQAEAPARQAEASARQAEAPAPQPAAPAAVQPAVHEQASAPDDGLAKARGGEARRAEGNRKLERRQQWTERQWTERRRYKQRPQQELIAVEEKVREDTEPRREFAADPIRIEMPQIRLFGPE